MDLVTRRQQLLATRVLHALRRHMGDMQDAEESYSYQDRWNYKKVLTELVEQGAHCIVIRRHHSRNQARLCKRLHIAG